MYYQRLRHLHWHIEKLALCLYGQRYLLQFDILLVNRSQDKRIVYSDFLSLHIECPPLMSR